MQNDPDFVKDVVQSYPYLVAEALRKLDDMSVEKYLRLVRGYYGDDILEELLLELKEDLLFAQKFVLNEHHLYGSSRLGVKTHKRVLLRKEFSISGFEEDGTYITDEVTDSLVYVASSEYFCRVLAQKQYELSNHLGNVLATVLDRRTGVFDEGADTLMYYVADVVSATLYYPFGSSMMSYSNIEFAYSYSFNGAERDNEISGIGNHYTALYWEMDPRLGRRWNLDPKYFANESRYSVLGNNPIIYVDPLGDFKTKFGAWLYKVGHGGEIGRDAKSGQYFVGKQVEYKGEGVGVAYQRRFDWNGSNQPYTGSGWGHSARSLAANLLGVDGSASSLWDMGMNSMLQNRSVQLTGNMLDKVKQDPAVQRLEDKIVSSAQSDSRFGKEAFSFPYKQGVQLGGERGSLNPLDPNSAATWQVAANPLTWAVRSVNIEAQVQVSAEGCMNITYQFTDNFDLRPEKGGKVYFGEGKRPWQYNTTTSILGLGYHDLFGGNDKMKVNATWQSNR